MTVPRSLASAQAWIEVSIPQANDEMSESIS